MVGVWFRKGLSVPQAFATYVVGPLLGLVGGGLWYAIWKLVLHERDLLGTQAVNRLVPWAIGALVAYVAPFAGLVFRRGRALAMGIVAVLAPVFVGVVVNVVLMHGGGGGIEPLWACLLVVVPTAFCLAPGESPGSATATT